MRTTAPSAPPLRSADLLRLAGLAGLAAVLVSPDRKSVV